MYVPFVDFHSHDAQPALPDVVRVVSLNPLDAPIHHEGLSTVGLHPWSTALPNAEAALAALPAACAQQGVVGVGEVGLDRLRGAPLPQQRSMLARQLQLAAALQLPVVLHCVRTWPELLVELRPFATLRWAVHGFRGSPAVARSLLLAGGCISIGPALLSDARLAGLVPERPLERLFLETDGHRDVPIQVLYRRVAGLRGMGVDALKCAMVHNFNSFFGQCVLSDRYN